MTRERKERTGERTGVRFLLTPGTEIPDWVRQSPGVSLGAVEIYGREIPTVDVMKGDGGFIPGGATDLKTGRRVPRVAFGPRSVLEIQTLDGDLIERNHFLCVRCGDITGETISFSPSREKPAQIVFMVQCTQNPEHRWEYEKWGIIM